MGQPSPHFSKYKRRTVFLSSDRNVPGLWFDFYLLWQHKATWRIAISCRASFSISTKQKLSISIPWNHYPRLYLKMPPNARNGCLSSVPFLVKTPIWWNWKRLKIRINNKDWKHSQYVNNSSNPHCVVFSHDNCWILCCCSLILLQIKMYLKIIKQCWKVLKDYGIDIIFNTLTNTKLQEKRPFGNRGYSSLFTIAFVVCAQQTNEDNPSVSDLLQTQFKKKSKK
jgi:hypothetical protein